MPNIYSLRFDARGWKLDRESGDDAQLVYEHEDGDVLSVHFFPQPPDIGAPLSDLAPVRAYYRDIAAQAGGGLVEAETLKAGGADALRTIIKFPMHEDGRGRIYLGCITVPRRDFSYVVKVQCPEYGMTGARETLVMVLLQQRGGEMDGPFPKGWMGDPYEPGYKAPCPFCISDREEFDEAIPVHPLSRARRHLKHVAATLELDQEILRQPPFTGPQQER